MNNNNIILADANLTQFIKTMMAGEKVFVNKLDPIRISYSSNISNNQVPNHNIGTRFNNIMSKKNGDDPNAPQFEFRDNNKNKILVQTTSSSYYTDLMDNETLPKGGICTYHSMKFDDYVYSYPIKHEIVRATGINENGETVYYRKHRFYRKGTIFCGFSCALAYLDELCCGRSFNSSFAEEARVLLLTEFDLMYPGQNIRPANDRLLLKSNGGHMEYHEWVNSTYTLFPTNYIINVPTKTGYIARSGNERNDNYDSERVPERGNEPKVASSPMKMLNNKKPSAFGALTSQIMNAPSAPQVPKGNFNPLKIIPKLGIS